MDAAHIAERSDDRRFKERVKREEMNRAQLRSAILRLPKLILFSHGWCSSINLEKVKQSNVKTPDPQALGGRSHIRTPRSVRLE